jgi:hypothetical protein
MDDRGDVAKARCDASIWDDLIATLVPRDADGRIQLDRIARRPARCPECVVVRDTMCGAWYAAIGADPQFRAALGELFADWSDGRAERLAGRWLLGRHGLSDLRYSFELWSAGWLKTVTLQEGSRLYGEFESVRRVPSGLVNRGRQRIGAQRLYRARVLGWTWKRIAGTEAEEGGRDILDEDDLLRLADTVRQDVYRWQCALGLPRRPRGCARRPKRS